MSKPKIQDKVMLFFAILYSENFNINSVLDVLKNEYGDIIYSSDDTKFLETSYYNNEMGLNISRKFVFFRNKLEKNSLVRLKKFSDNLEDKYLDAGKRTVNLDPGLFSKESILLATNKSFTHRVYLDAGVYADLTLYYKNSSYQALDWTFSEYRKPEIIAMFNSLRKSFL